MALSESWSQWSGLWPAAGAPTSESSSSGAAWCISRCRDSRLRRAWMESNMPPFAVTRRTSPAPLTETTRNRMVRTAPTIAPSRCGEEGGSAVSFHCAWLAPSSPAAALLALAAKSASMWCAKNSSIEVLPKNATTASLPHSVLPSTGSYTHVGVWSSFVTSKEVARSYSIPWASVRCTAMDDDSFRFLLSLDERDRPSEDVDGARPWFPSVVVRSSFTVLASGARGDARENAAASSIFQQLYPSVS
mmetsp:Transcript_9992/g.34496  ORF Transcript_9992/g.34496 Transcript_9992/m.34496 type:complete len:247 (-) Transcript_9992:115-855(-)